MPLCGKDIGYKGQQKEIQDLKNAALSAF